MGHEQNGSLADLLDRVRFYLQEPIDFTRPDTQTTLAKVRILAAAATYFNVLSLSRFGGRAGIAD
jgi:hypothetical protein